MAFLASLALSLVPGHARAACTVTVDGMNFGNVSPLGSPVDVQSNLTFHCTGFATPYVRVCASMAGTRTMTGSGGTLEFNLYLDAARTQVWGSIWSAPETATISANIPLASGSGSATVPVYGRLNGNQVGAGIGAYSRTLAGNDTGVTAFAYSTTPPVCTTAGYQSQFSMALTATVIPDCTMSASNIDFGSVGMLREPANATGVVTATCSKGASYSLGLGTGLGSGATTADRRMTRAGGGETLGYGLYRDSGRTQVWGDSVGSDTVSGTGTGVAQTSTVYATLPVQAPPPPGSYADTITVTITF